ncbi:AAA family ATPase [Deinococcus planocerae]|uniref:AAA family ATPase n=1 Tax=Deinococcus planocerae TaxID=1737569 RepID=UPI000C7F4D2D|nr:ATP-binding protein [Deinococcus planocerae]
MSGIHLPFDPGDEGSIVTLEGWRAYVNQKSPDRPPLLLPEEYEALERAPRAAYNRARRLYTVRFGPLQTREFEQSHRDLWAQLQANVYAPRNQVKVGGVIDGHPLLGKTTIAQTLGRRLERWLRRQATFNSPEDEHQFIPVVYVTLTGDTTPRALNLAICQFLGLPLPRGARTEAELTHAIRGAVDRHRIFLIIVDDIHFLRPHRQTKESDKITDHLKGLMSMTGATFLYAGIDCEKIGLFKDLRQSGPRGSQTGGRFMHCLVHPFEKGSPEWKKLVRTVESHLVLLRHDKGTLHRLHGYLYNRTQGSIGSLMTLVRKAALAAIDGSEAITKATLDTIKLDYNAASNGSLGEE